MVTCNFKPLQSVTVSFPSSQRRCFKSHYPHYSNQQQTKHYSSHHSADGKEPSAWTGSYPRIGFPSGMKHVVFTYFHGFTKIRFYFVFCFVRPLIENKNPLVQRILRYASDGRIFRFYLVVRRPFDRLRDRFLLQAQGPDASTSSASAPPQ